MTYLLNICEIDEKINLMEAKRFFVCNYCYDVITFTGGASYVKKRRTLLNFHAFFVVCSFFRLGWQTCGVLTCVSSCQCCGNCQIFTAQKTMTS